MSPPGGSSPPRSWGIPGTRPRRSRVPASPPILCCDRHSTPPRPDVRAARARIRRAGHGPDSSPFPNSASPPFPVEFPEPLSYDLLSVSPDSGWSGTDSDRSLLPPGDSPRSGRAPPRPRGAEPPPHPRPTCRREDHLAGGCEVHLELRDPPGGRCRRRRVRDRWHLFHHGSRENG
jgi:hypothetical protein